MATIYLIRHGQASFGDDDYDRLSPLGRRQAEVLGSYIQQSDIRFDAVYSGDLLRQSATAEIAVAKHDEQVPHHIDPRFNEVRNDEQIRRLVPEVTKRRPEIRDLIERGLKESKDYQKVIEAVFNYWISPECTASDIQTWQEFSGNAREALRQVMSSQGAGKTLGVFSSGGTIATIVAQVLGVDESLTYKFYEPMLNCSMTRLFYNSRRVSLSYFNDHSFLDVLGRQNGERLLTYR